jgi:hypothetical protein
MLKSRWVLCVECRLDNLGTWFDIQLGREIFFFSKISTPFLLPAQPMVIIMDSLHVCKAAGA